MPSDSACDRCHYIKARCLAGPAGNCYRCYRLHHLCTFSRRRGRRGPKPRVAPISRPSFSPDTELLLLTPDWSIHAPYTASNQDNTNQCGDTTNITLNTLYFETSLSQISEYTSFQICKFFSFGPLLSMEMCQLIRSRLKEAPTLLLRPYATVARVFIRYAANQAPCSELDWSNCASALETLRNAQITKPDHVGSFLSLGMSLVTFHRLISGISASNICRYTLSCVRSYYYAGVLDESNTRELLCLIFLDTTQSLFRAEVPVIEYVVRDPYAVDQHAGLCGPLLPLLYRVCVLAVIRRTAKGSSLPPPSHFETLAKEIEQWVPNISQSVLNRFSDVEMFVLISQVKIHRTSALLILHRIQYCFGERDDEAESFAAAIVTDMTRCLEVAEYYPPNITLGLLVAGAEIKDAIGRQQILSLVSGIRGMGFYPFVINLRMFLARIWADRDKGTVRYLFRVFEDNPDLGVPL